MGWREDKTKIKLLTKLANQKESYDEKKSVNNITNSGCFYE